VTGPGAPDSRAATPAPAGLYPARSRRGEGGTTAKPAPDPARRARAIGRPAGSRGGKAGPLVCSMREAGEPPLISRKPAGVIVRRVWIAMPPRTSVAICAIREPLQQQMIEHGRPEAAPGHFGPRASVGTIGQHGKCLPGRIGGRDRHRSSQPQRGPFLPGPGRGGTEATTGRRSLTRRASSCAQACGLCLQDEGQTARAPSTLCQRWTFLSDRAPPPGTPPWPRRGYRAGRRLGPCDPPQRRNGTGTQHAAELLGFPNQRAPAVSTARACRGSEAATLGGASGGL
jgi:hypothetical protein